MGMGIMMEIGMRVKMERTTRILLHPEELNCCIHVARMHIKCSSCMCSFVPIACISYGETMIVTFSSFQQILLRYGTCVTEDSKVNCTLLFQVVLLLKKL